MSVLTEQREKIRKGAIRQRRRKLNQEHQRVIDWLDGIADNYVYGDDDEAADFIKQLTSYIERLAILVGERQQRRLAKRNNHKVSNNGNN